ncbi:MAG: UvrD-helicase domain-containing protein [Muribaculaceae bacterium]|nr:UvrD-helicase domain-containing protein [Muribaculaceae bacterium]
MRNITYINAGAGSGKTYKLTETLADALQSGQYKPSEVILTTFTELAAVEFREKARAKLYERNMPEVANQLAAATIGTVHSVALRFVQKYWYLIGISPDPKVMTDEDSKVYTSQSLANHITPQQLQFFREYADFFGLDDPDFWRENLLNLIAKLDAYAIDIQQSRALSLAAIDQIFTGSQPVGFEALVRRLQNSLHVFDNETTKKVKSAVEDIRSWIVDESHPLPYHKALDLLGYIGAEGTFKNVRGNARCDKLKAEMGEADFNSLASDLVDYIKVAPREWMKTMVNHIFDIADGWHKEFIAFKRDNHIIDYNDMERLFLQLLGVDAVKQEIQGTYRLLLVDEFQDSSPIQIEIFKRLSYLMNHSYWVGDPKQSIYGFRGTDVELVKQLVDELGELDGQNGINVDRLKESYRSRPALVNLVTDCFVRAYNGVLSHDQVELQPHRNEVAGLAEPLSHWILPGGRANAPRFKALAARVKQLIDSGTKVVIKDTETTRDLQPGDIAILCRTNKNCKALAQSLKCAGVPVAVIDGEITQQTEVRLVVALLNMMVSPNNKHVRAEVLHLLGDKTTQDVLRCRLQYLKSLEQKPEDERKDIWMDDEPLIKDLLDYRRQVANMSVTDMVQSIVYGLGLNEVVAKWGDREARQQNLATLVDLARQYDQHCVNMGIGAAVGGFINYLFSTTIEHHVDNAANAVKVLTYHKAKGLEWNYVILYGLENDALDDQEFAKNSFWGMRELRQNDGTYLIQYLPRIWKAFNSNLDNSVINAIQTMASYRVLMERTINEERNKLYVGMTRARDYLTTTGQDGKTLEWVKNTGISAGDVDNLWQYNALRPTFESLQAVDISTIAPTVEQRVAYPEKGIISNEPKYLSPSVLTLPEGEAVDVEVVARFGDRISHGSVSEELEAIFGTCIHNIFAVYDPAASREENITRAKRIRDGYNLLDALPNLTAVIESIESLYSFLEQTYGPAQRIDHETPFVHVLDGQEVHGEIDLLWYTAPGECVLVDFKNYLGSEKALTNPADKHYAGRYAPQLQAYYNVLTQAGNNVRDKLIYYSVLRRVVKV